jgi:hypothetical protein
MNPSATSDPPICRNATGILMTVQYQASFICVPPGQAIFRSVSRYPAPAESEGSPGVSTQSVGGRFTFLSCMREVEHALLPNAL